METLEQFLKSEYDIKPYSNLYDISMDIHCDVGYSELYDDDLLKAISKIQGKKLTSVDKEQWFDAKRDWEEE
tara:strand:+ start:105 stop:320 length:216 start_codon:yes stop_codon:yes gene_type:complete